MWQLEHIEGVYHFTYFADSSNVSHPAWGDADTERSSGLPKRPKKGSEDPVRLAK